MRYDTDWTMATVRATRDLTPFIREITLAPEGGATPYTTGAHLKLRLLIDGRPDLRHYSLIGAQPLDGTWRIAVKREEPGRGGSRYMWSLPVGARLEISQPDSQFELSRETGACLLIAGGIGITPVVGMAQSLLRRGRPFRMLYAGRSRDQMAYLAELQAELGDHLTVFADDDGQKIDLAAEFAALPADAEAYVCGPLGLLEACRKQWAASGRAPVRLLFETFGSSGRFAPEPFLVRIPRLGREVLVPEGASMLTALEEAGVGVLADCRRGECGLCAVDVLAVEGTLDHRDVFFSPEQQAAGHQMCACVSRAVGGAITIDTAYRGDVKLSA